MTAAAEEATYVPDGDPCPKHGLPTRLLSFPGRGLYSQCQGCIDAFLAWHYQQHIHVQPRTTSAIPVEKRHHPQLELIA